MIRFLHTADWQLGKPFARVEDADKRSQLQQARIQAIQRMGDVARERQAQFAVVAGDLFDSPSATRYTVSAACGAIGAMGIPVFVIPGNHDHGGPGSIWGQSFFQREREQLAPNLTVCLTAEPVEFDDAVVFPCPLLRRHEFVDPTSWLRSLTGGMNRFGDKPRVVVAHGSVQGFNLQGDDEEAEAGSPNLIDLERLSDSDFDYIALGDWHGMKQVGGKAWYSGTPELDRFPKGFEHHAGYVLIVTADRGVKPEIIPVQTAQFGWHQLSFDFAADEQLARLREQISGLIGNRVGQDLLRLELQGHLGLVACTELEECIESWQARLLRLKLSNQIVVSPTAEEMQSLTQRPGDPLISSVAADLVELSKAAGDDARVAGTALRELYMICNQRAR